jgi:hypothetical protein
MVGSLIGAIVLILVPSALPASATSTGLPGATSRTTGPARTVDPVHPPRAAPHRRAVLPFLPRDRAAYKRGKADANSGHSGGRQGAAVHTIQAGRATPTPASSSIQVANNFHGDDLATQFDNYGFDNAVTPPDTTLGMGNGFVVEPLNDSLSIYNSTGQLKLGVDLFAFFASVLPVNHTLSDPQAVFDSVTADHRFYTTILGFNPTTSDSEVLLAASKTSDPTGAWNLYNTGTISGVLQDQPFLGIADDKLTISVNDFDPSGAFLGSTTTVLNKADADAGAGIHETGFGLDPFYFRPSPARSTSTTTTQYVVANDAPSLDVMAITGLPTAATNATRAVTSLSIAPTAFPPDAVQPGPGPSISTGDPRTLEAVWQSNALWVGANDGCTPSGESTERSCSRLIQLAAPMSGTPSVTQDFDMAATGASLYYPGVALDQSQNLYVPLSLSDATVYPSGQVLAFAGGSPIAPTVATLQSGSLYEGVDSSSAPVRWGDYSGAAIDPSNPTDVWVATEFAGGNSALGAGTNWATQLSQVTITPSALERSYHPLTPARITDTRAGSGFPNAGMTLGPGGTRNVQVSGAGGVPILGATAAVLNVTVTNPTQQSFLTAWPTGATRPTASNLNFAPGQTVPNLAEVGLGTNGQVSVFNAVGSVDVVVDVEGYVGPSGTAGVGLYNPLAPARITDTRASSGFPNAGNTLGPGGILTVQVTNAGGVPATGVAAAVLNVTATNPTKQSFLTVWPKGASRPTASNLNFSPGQTVPNRVQVPVGNSGQVNIFNAAGSMDVVVDVGGSFTDSRAGSGFPNAGNTLGPGGMLTVQVAGAGGVPATAVTAGVLNVTVTNTTQSSFLTVWPTATAKPVVSDLNWVPGQTVPNIVVVKLGPDGTVQVFNASGSVDVVVDVSGWYS